MLEYSSTVLSAPTPYRNKKKQLKAKNPQKSVKISRSYRQLKRGNFLTHSVLPLLHDAGTTASRHDGFRIMDDETMN